MNYRHVTQPVDEISGTVDEVSAGGITLNEFPGRRFQFSSVSTSAADVSARILSEKNDITRVPRPSNPQKPSHARAGNPLLPSKHLLFPSHDNSSFLRQFGRPEFWPNLQQKAGGTCVSLRGIATYSSKEPILPQKSAI